MYLRCRNSQAELLSTKILCKGISCLGTTWNSRCQPSSAAKARIRSFGISTNIFRIQHTKSKCLTLDGYWLLGEYWAQNPKWKCLLLVLFSVYSWVSILAPAPMLLCYTLKYLFFGSWYATQMRALSSCYQVALFVIWHCSLMYISDGISQLQHTGQLYLACPSNCNSTVCHTWEL